MIYLRLALFILFGGFIAVSMVWTMIASLIDAERPPAAFVIASFVGTAIGFYWLISACVKVWRG